MTPQGHGAGYPQGFQQFRKEKVGLARNGIFHAVIDAGAGHQRKSPVIKNTVTGALRTRAMASL